MTNSNQSHRLLVLVCAPSKRVCLLVVICYGPVGLDSGLTLVCSWVESDRDESEDVNRIEHAFENATDGIRDVAKKGSAFLPPPPPPLCPALQACLLLLQLVFAQSAHDITMFALSCAEPTACLGMV